MLIGRYRRGVHRVQKEVRGTKAGIGLTGKRGEEPRVAVGAARIGWREEGKPDALQQNSYLEGVVPDDLGYVIENLVSILALVIGIEAGLSKAGYSGEGHKRKAATEVAAAGNAAQAKRRCQVRSAEGRLLESEVAVVEAKAQLVDKCGREDVSLAEGKVVRLINNFSVRPVAPAIKN